VSALEHCKPAPPAVGASSPVAPKFSLTCRLVAETPTTLIVLKPGTQPDRQRPKFQWQPKPVPPRRSSTSTNTIDAKINRHARNNFGRFDSLAPPSDHDAISPTRDIPDRVE